MTSTTFDPLVLDIFGQQPGLSNLFTQLIFIFALPASGDPSSQQIQIEHTLTKGLERLSESFPWIAGQVINTGTDPVSSNTGVYSIVPLNANPELVFKNLRDDSTMTMDVLRAAKFPFRLLDESLLCPRTTLHLSITPPQTSPVLVLQATFVQGGLLLTFVAQHNVMDMTSQSHIIRLFSKACNEEPFTAEEVKIGNMVRENAIPLLDIEGEGMLYTPGPDLARYVQDSASNSDPAPTPLPPPPTPKCSWVYFSFSSSSLASLKELATSTLPTGCSFVSTDDALTAFIWQCITSARLLRPTPHSHDSGKQSTLARAIDPRRYVGLPDTYPGLVQNMTYHSFAPSELVDQPLGVVAADLRAALAFDENRSAPGSRSLSYATRALATHLSKTTNKNVVSVTSSLDLTGYDLMLSSWAKEGSLHDLDFGLSSLLKLEAIRRPQFTPVESLLYLLPRAPGGEILLGACLRKEDLEALMVDETWGRYAEWVG